MIIVDKALAERAAAGNPVRVGLVGAGFMGRSIARQIIERVPGMEVVAIANRTLARAQDAYERAGVDGVTTVESAAQLDKAARSRRPVVTEDPAVLVESSAIEAVIEATGTVEFAAGVALGAIENGKHVILSNAELDGTVGPVLKSYADKAGVVLTDIDGDQPGAELNVYRFVRGIGLTPVLCGNIKGLLDHYRTPETQQGFAEQWDQAAYMVTSFADGSKISFEQAVVANATGMSVACRGMRGVEYHGHVEDRDHLALWNADELRRTGGIVDYTLGARPGAGVYVLAVEDDPVQRTYLDLYKMGEGPLYCFCIPYHLCYMEVPLTVARAVLCGDAAVSPLGHFVDVVATAKRDLQAGEKLDGIGWYTTYGQCENADVAQREQLLPIGVAEGCVLRRDVARDTVLSYDDVELPQGRTCDRLRVEQQEMRRSDARAA
ncbi:MAG: Gfo/Idh/MocA family oxidoreductase [Actinomycetota bacterium]|nr:Gfo/Idh/MocA family oxidoreductase [Actinomycetota bacterium]